VHVRGLVDNATREFARSLPGRPMDSQLGDAELLDQVDRLQRENDELKAELAAAHAGGASVSAVRPASGAGETTERISLTPTAPAADGAALLTPVPAETTPAAQPAPAESEAQAPAKPAAVAPAHSYTVQPHDTLFGIAKKVYGHATNANVRAILQANRSILPSTTALKPGMELKIP
jgi:nucleoid-associated protein YgaU